jgi:hypothetical protein
MMLPPITLRLVTGRALLPLGVLLMLGWAAGPVAAHDATGGADTVTNVRVTRTTFRTVLAVPMDFSLEEPYDGAHSHHCVATASAQVVNPGDNTVDNKYIFVLALDDTTPVANHPSARTIEFNDNAIVQDALYQEVSSTFFFADIPPGPHVIRWMARKVGLDDAPLTVDDASLALICTRKRL